MQYGDKLVLKENKSIVEVVAVFPGSQGFRIESGERYLGISIAGQIAYLPESLAHALFAKYEFKPIVIEKTVTDIIEEVSKPKKAKKKAK